MNSISKNFLLSIKSKYVLKNIVKLIPKEIFFECIRYNKRLQKLMDINLTDYMDFNKIICEITPKDMHNFSFFNNSGIKESLIHIYINGNENETTFNELNNNKNIIRLVKIKIDQGKSLQGLFRGNRSIKKIEFIKFNNKTVTDMSGMFDECSSLEEINFNYFKTDEVIDMNSMFFGCSSLKNLDLKNFNTKNVINMSFMFCGCSSLTELNLNNFETKNVKTMNNMFEGCSSLLKINLDNFTITLYLNIYLNHKNLKN